MATPDPVYDIQKISIEASTRCNYRCEFCSNRDPRVTRADMTPELFVTVLENIATTITLPPSLALSQKGEPFMNKHLAELVRLAKESFGFTYVYLSSNGYLCTPDRVVPVIEAGLDSVKFSFNAFDPTHYEATHGVDGYERVLENIRQILEYRRRHGSGIKVFTSSVSPCDHAWVEAEVRRAIGPLGALLDGAWRYPEYFTPIHAGSKPTLPENYDICPLPFVTVTVDANGELAACCRDYFGQLRYGNLATTPFPEAWNHTGLAALRRMLRERTLPEGHICYECLAIQNARKNEPFVWDVSERPGPEQWSTLKS